MVGSRSEQGEAPGRGVPKVQVVVLHLVMCVESVTHWPCWVKCPSSSLPAGFFFFFLDANFAVLV